MQPSELKPESMRANWAQLFAFAWRYSDVLKNLRKDPKTTIDQLALGTNGQYKELLKQLLEEDKNTAERTIHVAQEIQLAAEQPTEPYSGYLPIPRSPFKEDLLKQLNNEDIEKLLGLGLDGVLKFNVKKKLWAEVLLAVWNDGEKLKTIRRDPLKGLRDVLPEQQVKELQDSKYGILPLPDQANGLGDLKIEKLVDFLGDEENAEHLGGIFLVAT